MAATELILCPVDFSEPSEEASRFAVSLADRMGAKVELVHVHQVPYYGLPETAAEVMMADTAARTYAQRQLEALAARYSAHGVEVTPKILEGVPYDAIVQEAQRAGADLIVIGTHGRTGLRHLLLGSVAEKVVRTSSVPVCTVRPKA
ncbi:MAG: universal stress protein [Sandaracinaceae bacterium]|nr:universal stress protein [Sandaracinaceae bacterium]